MARPVHRPKSDRLDRVTMTLHLGRDGCLKWEAQGWSDTKRGSLWALEEEWAEDNPVYGPTDALHHLALVVCQDRPNSQERVFFSMNGGIGMIEESLPFPE